MATSRRQFLKASVLTGLSGHLAGPWNHFAKAQSVSAKFRFGLRERIVFLGDSITQGGSYVAFLETLIRLRHPKSAIEIHNHGISSETISGTSEPDHNPRRPWAHERFSRDVADWKPTLVHSCFGMNDGNYHPFESDRFEKYQQGIERLIERVQNEAQCKRLVISTPPPFDAYQRKNGDPEAISYGYRYPAVNYDQTLHRYAQWLIGLRQKGQHVIDLHSRLNNHLATRRQGKVSFTLMPDAVHPNSTGHAVMAIIMAEGFGLVGPRDTALLDTSMKPLAVNHGSIQSNTSGKETLLDWKIPAAWTFGPQVEQQSLDLEQVNSRFNALLLKVQSPEAGGYRIVIPQGATAPEVVRDVTSKELAEGVLIDPPANAQAPDRLQGEKLAETVMKHRQSASAAWRSRAMKLQRDAPERGPLPEELEAETKAAGELSAMAARTDGSIQMRIIRLA